MISPAIQATFLICFDSPGSDPEVGGGTQGSRGIRTLASQGEFFIGAGNVALVTVALSEVRTSVVLSNKAWPGEGGKESQMYYLDARRGAVSEPCRILI